MRSRLIANIILQFLTSLIGLFLILSIILTNFSSAYIAFLVLYLILYIASFTMGVITLLKKKDPNVSTLTTVSGILGILAGAWFSGFIVSLIATIISFKQSQI